MMLPKKIVELVKEDCDTIAKMVLGKILRSNLIKSRIVLMS